METLVNGFEFSRDASGNFRAAIDGKTTLTIQTFNDFVYVDLREYFHSRVIREILPTKRGVTLKKDEWIQLCSKSAEVQAAIMRLSDLLDAGKKPTDDQIEVRITDDVVVFVRKITTGTPGARVTVEKTTRKYGAQADTADSAPTVKITRITLTPIAWLKVFQLQKKEIESIVTLLDNEASLAREKRKQDRIAKEARCIRSILDLSSA